MATKVTPSGDFYQVDFDRKAPDAGQWEKLNFALRRMYEQFSKLQGEISSGVVGGGGGGSSGPVSTSPPLSGGGTPPITISIPQATGSVDGYLAATDWTTFSAKVTPARLINTTAPLAGGGNLSADVTISIPQATGSVDGYLAATDWTTFSAKVSNPMTTLGDIIYGGSSGVPTRLPAAAGSNRVLHDDGSTPYWDLIDENHFTFSNITTANATTSLHGLLPRLSGTAGQFLNGQGNWSTPSGQASGYTIVSFSGQTSVVVTHNFG